MEECESIDHPPKPSVDAIMWVEFVVGSLLCSERFFSGYSLFSPLLKNQHFQIPIRSGTHRYKKVPSAPWVNKLQYFPSKFLKIN